MYTYILWKWCKDVNAAPQLILPQSLVFISLNVDVFFCRFSLCFHTDNYEPNHVLFMARGKHIDLKCLGKCRSEKNFIWISSNEEHLPDDLWVFAVFCLHVRLEVKGEPSHGIVSIM